MLLSSFPGTGAGVTVYVIDTGIRYTHVDFGGRAEPGFDFAGGSGEDCHGHGTHCAGTVGGRTYGVAKCVTLKSVRVFDCFGSGSRSGIIAGVDFTARDCGGGRCVASMSLRGPRSSSVDNAVANAVSKGVVVVVAAGNANDTACNYSPAGEPTAITVGATQSDDERSSFSNYGPCVDLFAPGTAITSAWYTSDAASNTLSGTSMACPHVAGAAALLLQRGVSAGDVPSTIVSEATKGIVINPGSCSPNEFLYVE
ncbi:Subtilisin-like protease 2 [Holothuria leucospilota]|uniref:Subtilisin-like protease 2 n=1 Tax=Holothuria leucospilota TaxID=206669 RepID=A0A9Q1CT38_HOLLE|nr:Subtilisin-like protease 2 [Holothuria leucospilota]